MTARAALTAVKLLADVREEINALIRDINAGRTLPRLTVKRLRDIRDIIDGVNDEHIQDPAH